MRGHPPYRVSARRTHLRIYASFPQPFPQPFPQDAVWPERRSRKNATAGLVGGCTSRRPAPVTSRVAFSGSCCTETARNIPRQVKRHNKSMRYRADQRIYNPMGRFTPEMH